MNPDSISPEELANQLAVAFAGRGGSVEVFNQLLDRYRADPQVRLRADARLLEIARPADSVLAATTITLLGLLHCREAEQEMLGLLRRKFPEERLRELVSVPPSQIALEHLIFSKTIAALIRLDSNEGKAIAARLAESFADSWVGRICRRAIGIIGNKDAEPS